MARTSRDPFSPVAVPMKKKKNAKKGVVAAVVPAALGIRARKKNTASASDLLSNLDDESPRKSPPEDMPSYVPYSKRNAPRSTRAAAPQPPSLVYLPLLTQPPDDDCNPLDHNSPHKEPSVEFVERAARAAHPCDVVMRKRYTDTLRTKRLKENNEEYEPESFSGCLAPLLRPMADVQNVRLDVDHNFPDKEMLLMRVAEEANLRGVDVYCARSDLRDYACTGSKFCVKANHTEQHGWLVSVANVRESDEFGPEDCGTGGTEKLSSPFRTRWIVPLILPIIFESPAISNKNLRAALSLYGKEHALTDSILQEARTHAKAHLFVL